jgi:Fe-S oxidoreductase
MRPVIEAGVPVVGLEPSCVAVFRDEMIELFPENQDALRLHDQTFLLSEFLNKHAGDWAPPHVGGKSILHLHCHHKAIIGKQDELDMLKKMGIQVEEPEPGCCGLAGSFGFEAGKYGVSMAIGEQRLLPAIRKSVGVPVFADGFSCQTQIEQGTGRKTFHLAEVIARNLPEQEPRSVNPGSGGWKFAKGALITGGAILALGLLLRSRKHSRILTRGSHEIEAAQ